MESEEFSKYKTPMDYLKVFFRRKWFFLTPAVICAVSGIVMALVLPPLYQSSTTILVEEEKIINPLIQNLAVSTSTAQRLEGIKEVLLGWNNLAELIKKLNLDKNLNDQAAFERLIADFKESVEVQMKRGNIIQITFTGNDPEQTQRITQALTNSLIERNKQSQTKETDVAIKFIQEQLTIYKRKIKESEIADIQDQLKDILSDSTEQHPMVRELRQKLAIATRELETGAYSVTPSSDQSPASAAREALRQQIDTIISKETHSSFTPRSAGDQRPDHEALYKILLMDKAGSSVARDMNVNTQIYNMLLQRLETAKITMRLEASKEGTHYTIIEPPRIPLKPSRPNRILIMLMGLGGGICAGAALVLSREFLDNSLLDIEDAKARLALPVLGAISRITTQEEIRGERIRHISLTALFCIFSGLAITVAYVYSLLNK